MARPPLIARDLDGSATCPRHGERVAPGDACAGCLREASPSFVRCANQPVTRAEFPCLEPTTAGRVRELLGGSPDTVRVRARRILRPDGAEAGQARCVQAEGAPMLYEVEATGPDGTACGIGTDPAMAINDLLARWPPAPDTD